MVSPVTVMSNSQVVGSPLPVPASFALRSGRIVTDLNRHGTPVRSGTAACIRSHDLQLARSGSRERKTANRSRAFAAGLDIADAAARSATEMRSAGEYPQAVDRLVEVGQTGGTRRRETCNQIAECRRGEVPCEVVAARSRSFGNGQLGRTGIGGLRRSVGGIGDHQNRVFARGERGDRRGRDRVGGSGYVLGSSAVEADVIRRSSFDGLPRSRHLGLIAFGDLRRGELHRGSRQFGVGDRQRGGVPAGDGL